LENFIWYGNASKDSETIRETLLDSAIYNIIAIIVYDEEGGEK